MERFSKYFDTKRINRSLDWREQSIAARKADSRHLSKNIEPMDCPICGSADNEHMVQIYGFDYGICDNCGVARMLQIPASQSLRDFYTDGAYEAEKQPGEDLISTDSFHERVNLISTPKVQHVLDNLNKPAPYWVDIGCGVGDLVQAANNLGAKAIGYDIDMREISHGIAMGANIKNVDITDENAGELLGEADIISLISVIEHVPNPHHMLKSILDHSKPDATIVIEVPRFHSISSLTNLCFTNLVARHMLPPQHLSLFTDESFKYLADSLELSIDHVWYYGSDANEIFGTLLQQSVMAERHFGDRIYDLILDIQQVFDRHKLCDEMFVMLSKRQ